MHDMAVDDLPKDVKALQALLLEAHRTISSQQKELHSLHRLIHAYQEEKRLAAARQFAPSSEKEARQYYLFNEAECGAGESEEAIANATIEVKVHQRRGGRKPLPANLPRIEILHDLSDEEKHCSCGCTKVKIGEEVSEQLDIIPAKVRVLKHIRFKYACQQCDTPPQTAPCHPSPYPKAKPARGSWPMSSPANMPMPYPCTGNATSWHAAAWK